MAVAESPIAQSALPAGVADEYAGRWIAVRRGEEVVADAASLPQLVADERVRDDDTVFHVPTANAAFF